MRWRHFLSLPLIRALMVLAVMLALVMTIFTARYQLETEKAIIDFTQRAEVRVNVLTERIHAAITALESVNQFFAVSTEEVSRTQFRQLTQPLLAKHPYIQTFVFHRLVTLEQRQAFETRGQAWYPGFRITELQNGKLVPALPRPVYLVDDYVEPLKGNEKAPGYDALADPIQAEAFFRATDTGLPAATGLKNILQGKKLGFTVVMPVYRKNAVLSDVAARRAAVIGDTEVVFIAEDLVRKILESTGMLNMANMHLRVYAADRPDDSALVFSHGAQPGTSSAHPILEHWLGSSAIPPLSHTFDLAGKPWHIVVSSVQPPFRALHFGSLIILTAGVLLSLAVALRVQSAAIQSRRIEEMVRLRTVELQSTMAALQLRQRAIEASANAIVIISAQSPDFPIEYVNPAFESVSGYSSAEAMGKPAWLMCGKEAANTNFTELQAAIQARQEAHATVQSCRKDGSLYWNEVYIAPVRNEHGEVCHYVCNLYDVTATKRYEEELEFKANYDTLTGLANRNLLRDRLSQAISYASHYQHAIWVAFVDLDRFKFVNDSLGHEAGDKLIQIVADRIRSQLRDTDTAARLGGNEFVLLLSEDGNPHYAEQTISSILTEVAKPFLIGGKELFVTCSIGIAIYPHDAAEPDTLISFADIAMFRAKEAGGNNFRFFESSMNERSLKRLRLEGDLRRALDRGELLLHYQPQVALPSRQVIGMEALVRWQHPMLGTVSPAGFIDIAEETGLILQIGEWALRTACRQNQAWQTAGLGALRVAVNLSAVQFAQPDVVQMVSKTLADTGLDPACLEIEITEGMVMSNTEVAILNLHKLKSLGVKLSIDDFGTGYSSLSYLQRFPIDVLKIDQSFIRDIATDQNSAMIVSSIIAIAHNLKLRVIAEGVETEEQLDFLQSYGCDEIQGYYFSKPLPATAFERILHNASSAR